MNPMLVMNATLSLVQLTCVVGLVSSAATIAVAVFAAIRAGRPRRDPRVAAALEANARTFAEVEQLGTIVDQLVADLGEMQETVEVLAPYRDALPHFFARTIPSLRWILNNHADGLDELSEQLTELRWRPAPVPSEEAAATAPATFTLVGE
jgi:hypothetical protein